MQRESALCLPHFGPDEEWHQNRGDRGSRFELGQKFLVTETGGGRKIYEVTQNQTGGPRTEIRSDQHHSAIAVAMSRQWRRSAGAPLKYRPSAIKRLDPA